jgi:hypothetical protein
LKDWGIILAVVMLVIWAAGTLLEWSGWVHALLTAGIFLLIYRTVASSKRGNRTPRG